MEQTDADLSIIRDMAHGAYCIWEDTTSFFGLVQRGRLYAWDNGARWSAVEYIKINVPGGPITGCYPVSDAKDPHELADAWDGGRGGRNFTIKLPGDLSSAVVQELNHERSCVDWADEPVTATYDDIDQRNNRARGQA